MKSTQHIVLVAVLALIAAGAYFIAHFATNEAVVIEEKKVTEVLQNGTTCYTYDQIAKPEAPYEVHEIMTITKNSKNEITGTKQGTQVGPDMSNGYTATLVGDYADGEAQEISVRMTAQIEGSTVIEQEIYEVTKDALIKLRYPLVDGGAELVPDVTQPFSKQLYPKVTCKEDVVMNSKEVKVASDLYTFMAPENWTASFNTFDGCLWGGLSNDTSDGHRMAGEIGIYPKSCFDITKSNGKQDMEEKDGYYIISYYDTATGTTAAEIAETKNVFKRIVATFKVK